MLYMKPKPIKFGIRFYAVVGWRYAHLHCVMDDGSENKTGVPLLLRYTRIFRHMRGEVHRQSDKGGKPKDSAISLWCTHPAHQTQLYPSPSKRKLIVMDNFYTQQVLITQFSLLSDRNCRVLRIVRLKNVPAHYKLAVKEAVETLKKGGHGK